MIKEVTIYVGTDGSRFETIKEAERYEALYEKCEKIMGQLRVREKDYAVRQDINLVKKVFAEFMDLCCKTIPLYKYTFTGVKNGDVHPIWAQRVITDYGARCLENAFYRFDCINMESGIEYEQPYYVNHESEWKLEIQ